MKFIWIFISLSLAVIKLNFDVYHGDDVKHLKDGERNKNRAYAKRDGELMVIQNTKTWYLAELQFGQNKDLVGVLVDTGSSDLWLHSHDVVCMRQSSYYDYYYYYNVDDKKETVEHKGAVVKATSYDSTSINWSRVMSTVATTNTCTSHGSFNTADSDSYHLNETAPAFEIAYYDGTFARGTWGQDSLFFGNVEVSDVSFAIANFTDSEMGVFGIGLPGLEMTYDYIADSGYQYENFPMKLKSEGLIAKNLYSLYLNTLSSSTGSVLFGAVDHAKYEGTLQTVPMIKYNASNDSAVRTQVLFTGATFISNNQTHTISEGRYYNALLDSGSTLTYLPSTLYSKFLNTFNTTYSSYYGEYELPCTNDRSLKVEFDFNGAKIKVPLIDLMIPTETNTCILGLLRGDGYLIVGDNVLRNGYFVFDLDSEEISMAQVKITNDEDIEEITSTIPSAVRVVNYSYTDTYSVSYPSTTRSEYLTYSTGDYSVDGEFLTAIWGLTSSSRTSNARSSSATRSGSSRATSSGTTRPNTGTKSSIGYIYQLISIIFGILFL